MEVTERANRFKSDWKKMINTLIRFESQWIEVSKGQIAMSENDFDSLPVEIQIFARQTFLRSSFNVGIDGLIRLALAQGGYETLVIPRAVYDQKTHAKPVPKPKKEEKKEEPEAKAPEAKPEAKASSKTALADLIKNGKSNKGGK